MFIRGGIKREETKSARKEGVEIGGRKGKGTKGNGLLERKRKGVIGAERMEEQMEIIKLKQLFRYAKIIPTKKKTTDAKESNHKKKTTQRDRREREVQK